MMDLRIRKLKKNQPIPIKKLYRAKPKQGPASIYIDSTVSLHSLLQINSKQDKSTIIEKKTTHVRKYECDGRPILRIKKLFEILNSIRNS